MNKIYIYIENGSFFEANSFGVEGTKAGEIVFNTSLTGYQEIITDPSYAGQFVNFTMSEIGNIGCNQEDEESNSIFLKGIIVNSYNEEFSNYRAKESLSSLLKKNNILGISDIDTRFLTKLVRENGSMMMIASTEISEKNELKKLLNNFEATEKINFLDEVSTRSKYIYKNSKFNQINIEKKIIALDLGIKRNILNNFLKIGIEVEVVPHNTPSEYISEEYKLNKIDGVFISNGPGNPAILKDIQNTIKNIIILDIPIFGICLGHQLLSICFGYETYKLKFGHHGGNHPVKNIKNNSIEITAQNHNYNVPDNIKEIAEITHINLFDDTIEGLKYKNKNIISVQYHPESSPGPNESSYIFKEFKKILY